MDRDLILQSAKADNPNATIRELAEATGIPASSVQRWTKRVDRVAAKKYRGSFDNVVKLCDFHIPYEDKKAVGCALNYCGETQPEIIILDEVHDFYELSRFDKNPQRKHDIQDEIDQSAKTFKRLRKLCPDSRIILLKSNHLDRLRRFLWKEGAALSSLRCLQLETLLELEKLDIEYMHHFFYKDVLFKHGDLVRKHSAYTAKGEFEKEGCSGTSGHTHRLGIHFTTKRGGSYCWVEGGCLCDLNPEYIEGVPDWQHGITQFTFESKGHQFYPQAIPIIDGKIIHGNKIITY